MALWMQRKPDIMLTALNVGGSVALFLLNKSIEWIVSHNPVES
jgi:hypothetical protein